MTTRISQNQLSRTILTDILDNRERLNKYSNEISSGLKVIEPGDSKFSGTISQYRETLSRLEGHLGRVSAVTSYISFQDNVVTQVNDLLIRAKELATQAANETYSAENRAQVAKEVFAIRDQIVDLANSKYQGKYVYGGTDDDDPPYDAAAYDMPASGSASERYVYDDTSVDPGGALTRTVNLTDDISIVVNTPGNQIFDNAIQALERLGRALEGYSTNPASGAPDGTGAAYNLPDETALQTRAISDAINLIDTARESDIMPERVSLGARLRRLESAESLIGLTRTDAEEVLNNLQSADLADAATNLQQAQTALEASYTVSARILNLSILDYL